MDLKVLRYIEKPMVRERIFAHDIKNHLIQIRNMENEEEIHKYIDKLSLDIDEFQKIGISKNKMLDLIISKYVTLCEIKNIDFKIDVKTANLKYVDDVDLSTLFNNLLDNAVESAEKSKEKFIEMSIFSRSELYDAVIITNSADVKPNKLKDKLVTTKADKNFHGIGLLSIKKIIKKYDAIYDWNYNEKEKVFETNIAFPKTI